MSTTSDPDKFTTRAAACEESENLGRNPSGAPSMGEIIGRRFGRRDVLKGTLAVVAISATLGPLAFSRAWAGGAGRFAFAEVQAGVDETHHVAEGYDADVLIRWGDPVMSGAPAFDPLDQSAAAQAMQFGYNNDFIGYLPMRGAAEPGRHGLLCINHEYTNEELMFPGLGRQDGKDAGFARMSRALVDIEMAAHGGSVIEVRREDGKWRVVGGSPLARRITATTPMVISGPAAGHPRLRTSGDPSGHAVEGMINNCAGGMTPWGTWLTAEENFHGYFWGKLGDDHPEVVNYKRYGVPGNWMAWGRFHDRFDVAKEPNEANRFGWIVEVDPFDPASMPKKRTALGRFKHEGAETFVNGDGRVVVYMGDDERFEYVYRFVTTDPIDGDDHVADPDLLDRGTLSVARFDADGSVTWLPLVHGEGALNLENGFASQADVLIETRRAADLLGATPMDRPEDVQANPRSGKVYVMLTNNTRRKPDQADAANPRARNAFGHIIEMTAPDGDHAAPGYTWEILVQCGDPTVGEVGATFSSATTKDGWFAMPDNCAIDGAGRLWVATDGNSDKDTGRSDGLWAVETDGEARGTSRHFFRCPVGAELCGPAFTPDDETLFVSVQHPGDGGKDWAAFGRVSTFDDPSTRWPDFDPGMPPRPSVVVITRKGGGKIGV
jgi:hypothetical protein